MPAIVAQLEKVSRMFGRFPALRQVSMSFEAGRCYVLLGENGAGKSTLLRIVAGLLQPSSGVVRVFSEQLGGGERQPELRARLGYMSHAPMLYDELSAVENLRYFASLYRTSACLTPEEALRLVALDPALERPVGQYSQGMRQRASLARVLLPQPELVLLDEPFSNMDAASARQMVALLTSWRAARRTVVLTTHQREVASPLADYFLSMEAGRLVSIDAGPALARDSWAEARPV
jgi:heme ABC exporter ATP-binding subunit CcmA